MPKGGKRTKIDVTEDLIKRIADLAVDNMSGMKMAEELKLSRGAIKTIMRKPEYQDEVRAIIRTRMSSLAGLMVQVLEEQLREGSLEAVKLGLKALGAVEADTSQGSGQVQGITVIMPGAGKPEKEVDSVSYTVPEGE